MKMMKHTEEDREMDMCDDDGCVEGVVVVRPNAIISNVDCVCVCVSVCWWGGVCFVENLGVCT